MDTESPSTGALPPLPGTSFMSGGRPLMLVAPSEMREWGHRCRESAPSSEVLNTLIELADAMKVAADGGGVDFYAYANTAFEVIARAGKPDPAEEPVEGPVDMSVLEQQLGAVLAEVVACEDLRRSELRRRQRRDCNIQRLPTAVAEAAALRAEYNRRKDAAWCNARFALKCFKDRANKLTATVSLTGQFKALEALVIELGACWYDVKAGGVVTGERLSRAQASENEVRLAIRALQAKTEAGQPAVPAVWSRAGNDSDEEQTFWERNKAVYAEPGGYLVTWGPDKKLYSTKAPPFAVAEPFNPVAHEQTK